jgi:integrase
MSIERNPSGGWDARWRTLEGKSRKKHFERKADAVDHDIKMRRNRQLGIDTDPRAGRVTVKEFGQRWLEGQAHQREGSLTRLRHSLGLLNGDIQRSRTYGHGLGDRYMASVLRSDIASWLQLLKDSYKPTTVLVTWQTARRLFNAAIEEGIIVTSPCGNLRSGGHRAKVDPPRPDELLAICEHVPASWRSMVLVAAQTGLRPGEVLGLCEEQVDWLARRPSIWVDRQWVRGRMYPYTKTGAARRVALDWATVELLSAQLATYHAGPQGRIFCPEAGYHRTWARALARAGARRPWRLHDLRHFYASQMLARGFSVSFVAARLGHKDPSVTLRTYAHLIAEEDDRADGVISEVFSCALNVPSGARTTL